MNYRLTITPLTPLHIGDGSLLLRDYDFHCDDERRLTFVLDQDAIFEQVLSKTGQLPLLPAGRQLPAGGLGEDSPLVRYTLDGSTSLDEIHALIKDAQGRSYLPGSSIKGALRTCLMAFAYAAGLLEDAEDNYDKNPKGKPVKERAASGFERAAFRLAHDDANYDLLRALRVTDSDPLPLSPSPLALAQARVFTQGEPSAPIAFEAVRPGVSFSAELQVDEGFYDRWAEELGWEENFWWLAILPEAANRFARRRCASERLAAARLGLEETGAFYNDLLQRPLEPDQFLLQLSWGAGWGAKTIGEWLPAEEQWDLRQEYGLGKPPGGRGEWEPDPERPFPSSRRLLAAGDRPGLPLGWALAGLQPSQAPSPVWQALARQAQEQLQEIPEAPLPKASAPGGPPAAPTAEPEPQAPPPSKPQPLVPFFSALPQVGERFRGRVYDTERDGTLLVKIPGLSEDDFALALIAPQDNPGLERLKMGSEIVCEVLALEEEPNNPGYWLVKCRRL